ncbi:MAG: short-chain dehydrogenase/reductase [Hydrocarboniphaga sp.]|uniref:SDR family NAD(P)-dependent oxidoreductase n=1 Tax=Hydrocarboniphaga sp. TaxID=2033016 RepID=UPI002612CFF6|nr:SDR family oxidoreductase [Hydrocarboniphaga sp.]MDB5971414.1 short-chain dehydrogenase/reductase [Hydrocarboniphaga sp.]
MANASTWPCVAFNYSGAHVLVTGGTSGIGAGVAQAYRKAGASVTITGTRGSADKYEEDLSGYRYLQLDVTDKANIARVAAELTQLDVLVHSAGIGLASIGIDESIPDNFAIAIEMHLTSVYRLSHACFPLLAKSKLQGGGSIIGIASMASFFGMPIVPGYGAAKGGLVQLMMTLSITGAPQNIRANAVAAGMTASRQTSVVTNRPEAFAPMLSRTPLGRFGVPDDISGPVLFLTSPAAAYITGQTINVDGGFSIAG